MNKWEQFDNLMRCKHNQEEHIQFSPLLMHFAARFIGKTYAEFASDHKVLVEANLRCLDQFDLDSVGLISDPYRETSAFGARIEYVKEGVPKCTEPIISTIDDVRALKNPNLFRSGRTFDRIMAARELYKATGGSVPIIGWIEGPLAEACNLTGVSEMLLKLMIDQDFARMLLEKTTITAKEFAKTQIEAGCNIIGMGDAICSQISADDYQTYVKHLHKEVIDYIHSLGAYVKLHICGDIRHLLNDIKDIGTDILDVDWMVDMDLAHDILGEHILRCGNIDPVFIQNNNQEVIAATTRQLIEKEKGRGFIFSAGCEITVDTPHANLLAMRNASTGQTFSHKEF